jgi:hypothetical protein
MKPKVIGKIKVDFSWNDTFKSLKKPSNVEKRLLFNSKRQSGAGTRSLNVCEGLM